MASILGWIALVLAGGALLYGWKLSQEMHGMRRRLDRYNRALFTANDEIRQLQEQLAERTAALRVEIMQRTGSSRFTPEMTIRESQALHPQTQTILSGFHIGGCTSCAADQEETLRQVCERNGIPLEALLQNLNVLVNAHPAPPPSGQNGHGFNGTVPVQVKIPNVELDL